MGNFGNDPRAMGRTTGWIWQFAKEVSYAEEGSVERHTFHPEDVATLLKPEGREDDARGFLVTTDDVRLHIPERMVLDALSPRQVEFALRAYWVAKAIETEAKLIVIREQLVQSSGRHDGEGSKIEFRLRLVEAAGDGEVPSGLVTHVRVDEFARWVMTTGGEEQVGVSLFFQFQILEAIKKAELISFSKEPATCERCAGKGALDDRGFALRGQVFFETKTCPMCSGKGQL